MFRLTKRGITPAIEPLLFQRLSNLIFDCFCKVKKNAFHILGFSYKSLVEIIIVKVVNQRLDGSRVYWHLITHTFYLWIYFSVHITIHLTLDPSVQLF